MVRAVKDLNNKSDSNTSVHERTTPRANILSKPERFIFEKAIRPVEEKFNKTSYDGRLKNVQRQEQKLGNLSLEEMLKIHSDNDIPSTPATPYGQYIRLKARETAIEDPGARADIVTKARTDEIRKELRERGIKNPDDLKVKFAERNVKETSISDSIRFNLTRTRGLRDSSDRDLVKELILRDVQLEMAKLDAYKEGRFQAKEFKRELNSAQTHLDNFKQKKDAHELNKNPLIWEQFKGTQLEKPADQEKLLNLQHDWYKDTQKYYEARSDHEALKRQEPLKNHEEKIKAAEFDLAQAELFGDDLAIKNQTNKLSELNKQLLEKQELASFDISKAIPNDKFTSTEREMLLEHQKNENEKIQRIAELATPIADAENKLAEFGKQSKLKIEKTEFKYTNTQQDIDLPNNDIPGFHDPRLRERGNGPSKYLPIFRDDIAKRAEKIKQVEKIHGLGSIEEVVRPKLEAARLQGEEKYNEVLLDYTQARELLEKPKAFKLPDKVTIDQYKDTIDQYRDEPKVKAIIEVFRDAAIKGSPLSKLRHSLRYTFSGASQRKALEVIRFDKRENALALARDAYRYDLKKAQETRQQKERDSAKEITTIDEKIANISTILDKNIIEIKYRQGINQEHQEKLEQAYPEMKELRDTYEKQLEGADRSKLEAARAYLEQQKIHMEAQTLDEKIYENKLAARISELRITSNNLSQAEKTSERAHLKNIRDESEQHQNKIDQFNQEYRSAQHIIDKNVDADDKINPADVHIKRGEAIAEGLGHIEDTNFTEARLASITESLTKIKSESERLLRQETNHNNPTFITNYHNSLRSMYQLERDEAQIKLDHAEPDKKGELTTKQQVLYRDQSASIKGNIEGHEAAISDIKPDGKEPTASRRKELEAREAALAELRIDHKALELEQATPTDRGKVRQELQDLLHAQLNRHTETLANPQTTGEMTEDERQTKTANDRALHLKINEDHALQLKLEKDRVAELDPERKTRLEHFDTAKKTLEQRLTSAELGATEKTTAQQDLKHLLDDRLKSIELEVTAQKRHVQIAEGQAKQDSTKQQDLQSAEEELRRLQIEQKEHQIATTQDALGRVKHYTDMESLANKQIKALNKKISELPEHPSPETGQEKVTLHNASNALKLYVAQQHSKVLKAEGEYLAQKAKPIQENEQNKLALEIEQNKLAQSLADRYIQGRELTDLLKKKKSDPNHDSKDNEQSAKQLSLEKLRKTIAEQKITRATAAIKLADTELKRIADSISDKQDEHDRSKGILSSLRGPTEAQKKLLEEIQEKRVEFQEQNIHKLDYEIAILRANPDTENFDIEIRQQARNLMYKQWSTDKRKAFDTQVTNVETSLSKQTETQRSQLDALEKHLAAPLGNTKIERDEITKETSTAFLDFKKSQLDTEIAEIHKTYYQDRLKLSKQFLKNPFLEKRAPYLSSRRERLEKRERERLEKRERERLESDNPESTELSDFQSYKDDKADFIALKDKNERELKTLRASIASNESRYNKTLEANSIIINLAQRKPNEATQEPKDIQAEIHNYLKDWFETNLSQTQKMPGAMV